MDKKIGIVPGATRGIGYALVRALSEFRGEDDIVYLTARDQGSGRPAVAALAAEGVSARCRQTNPIERACAL